MLLFVRQKQYVGPLNRVDHLEPAATAGFFLASSNHAIGSDGNSADDDKEVRRVSSSKAPGIHT